MTVKTEGDLGRTYYTVSAASWSLCVRDKKLDLEKFWIL